MCNLEPVAYEFFTQAFMIYEEEIAVSGGFRLHYGRLDTWRIQAFGV